MILHPDTRSVISENKGNFTKELRKEIDHILDLVEQFSPMSDFNYLSSKLEGSFKSIKVSTQNASWAPIRNVIRLIGKIADLEVEGISGIVIESMHCGCDYFEGNVKIELTDGSEISGPYKWQWTAFENRIKSYDKFVSFPKISNIIAN